MKRMTNPCTSIRYDARYSCSDVCRLSRLLQSDVTPNQHNIDVTLAIVHNLPSETRTAEAEAEVEAEAATATAAARVLPSYTEHGTIHECRFFSSIAKSRTYRQELSNRSRTEVTDTESDRGSGTCITRYGERCNMNLIRLSRCSEPYNSVQSVYTRTSSSVTSNRTDCNHKCIIKQRNLSIETDDTTSEPTYKQTLCDIRHFVMSVLSRATTSPVRAGHWLLLSTVILAISFPTLANAQILNASKLAPSKESGSKSTTFYLIYTFL